MNINPQREAERIVSFIKKTLNTQKIEKVVIGLSGGLDSATSLYLLKNAIPKENIIISHLCYFEALNLKKIIEDLPEKNYHIVSIKKSVDAIANDLKINMNQDRVRFGNVMARVRMILLYDLAKKYSGLVCGTENRSENLLGYFTRFGDEASDIEPIKHLYKNQVCQLASYLGVPNEIIKQSPTAGLWAGQTDEKELGFSYREADQILYLYFDKNLSIKEIAKKGFVNAERIISHSLRNKYKNNTPYYLEPRH